MIEKMSHGKGKEEYGAHVAAESFTTPEERATAEHLLKEHGLEGMTIEKVEEGIEDQVADKVIASLNKGKMKQADFNQLLEDMRVWAKNYREKKRMSDAEIEAQLMKNARDAGAELSH